MVRLSGARSGGARCPSWRRAAPCRRRAGIGQNGASARGHASDRPAGERNGSLEGSLGQAGRAILDALDGAGLLSCGRDHWVETGRGALGEALVRLEGGNRADERLFLDSLHELLGPVENPRYLLVREAWLGRRLRIDYHAVPAAFGKKKLAEAFAKAWRRHVGSAKLVYLRDAAGRRLLLRARTRSLAAGMRRAVGGISLWR